MLAAEEFIEKVDKQFLVDLLPEDSFEAPVGKRIYELSHRLDFFVYKSSHDDLILQVKVVFFVVSLEACQNKYLSLNAP